MLINAKNEETVFVEPYSSLFSDGTTQQEATDGLLFPTGEFDVYIGRIAVLLMDYLAVNVLEYWIKSARAYPHGDPSILLSGLILRHSLMTRVLAPITAQMFISTSGDIHLGDSTAPPTKAELALSSRYTNAWLTFAKVNCVCDQEVRTAVDYFVRRIPKGLSKHLETWVSLV